MAIITTIREKSGLTIGVIAVSLVLFILGGDLFSNSSYLLGTGQDNTAAVINGEAIEYERFQQEIAELEEYYQATGQPMEDRLRDNIRLQAWQRLLFKTAYQEEFDQLGIQVTQEEWDDMIQGDNVHPMIRAFFTNQETGVFDVNQINQFLLAAQQGQVPPNYITLYKYMVKLVRDSRKQQKYEDLLGMGTFVTDAEAKLEHENTTRKADIKYCFISYQAVPDSLVSYTDDDLKKYYQAHQDEFEVSANRELDYLAFAVNPSDADIEETRRKAEQLKASFEKTTNDTSFVEFNSDKPGNPFSMISPSTNLEGIDFGNLQIGQVYGPTREGNYFRIFKVLNEVEDTANQYAKARHILFKVDRNATDEEKAALKQKAQNILTEIKAGADFAAKAREYGEDGTKTRGGDLGWFDKNKMVTPFANAVFGMEGKGLINSLVETAFGYHIVEVTASPTNKAFEIAAVDLEVRPGKETERRAYREAGLFAVYQTYDELKKAVEQDSTKRILMQANRFPTNAKALNNLQGSEVRDIVQWAYDEDTKIGDVSPVYRLDNHYVVVALKGKVKKNEKSFEAVRQQVQRKYVNQLKADYIKEKLGDTSGKPTEEIAAAYGPKARTGEQADLSFNSPSLQNVGNAPTAIGLASKMAEGTTSQPIAEESGVVVIEVTAVAEALKQQEYSTYQQSLKDQRMSRIPGKIKEALEAYYNAENEYYKFY